MSLILVTGTSTSGKSAVAKELTKLGYEAYDTEHHGISAWYNKKTGSQAAAFNEMPERTNTWLNQHEWLISMDWVTEISKKAHSKSIFLCGGSANESKVIALCDKIIWLKTDEQTIRKRVVNIRDHDYGTRPHELAATIDNNKHKEATYRKNGAIIIDATQPIEKVVDNIINLTVAG